MHEKKNSSTKFYLREIDIDKNLSGSAESLSISSSVGGTISSSVADDKNSKAEEFTASFVAQTNWSFVEKLLKVKKELIAVHFHLSFPKIIFFSLPYIHMFTGM